MIKLSRCLPLAIALALPCLATWTSPEAAAQTTRVLEGQVLDAGGEAIAGATVALQGIGFRLTDDSGRFRFGAVPRRAYLLRVGSLGYEDFEVSVVIDDDDVSITVQLEISPLQLDSLVVETRTVDLDGRVWDPLEDLPVQRAEVLSDRADPTRTSWGGRFSIRAGENTPVRIQIRAFRYLPLDTLVVARRDERHEFEMRPDSLVLRMLEAEAARLAERMGGLRAVLMPALDRADLARWRGASLRELIKFRFPGRPGPKCIVLDEQDVGEFMFDPTLDTVLADDVERVEFLFRGNMMRVYTTRFMRGMIGGGVPLRRPAYSDMADPPLCF